MQATGEKFQPRAGLGVIRAVIVGDYFPDCRI
jgi:hypothetical protein